MSNNKTSQIGTMDRGARSQVAAGGGGKVGRAERPAPAGLAGGFPMLPYSAHRTANSEGASFPRDSLLCCKWLQVPATRRATEPVWS